MKNLIENRQGYLAAVQTYIYKLLPHEGQEELANKVVALFTSLSADASLLDTLHELRALSDSNLFRLSGVQVLHLTLLALSYSLATRSNSPQYIDFFLRQDVQEIIVSTLNAPFSKNDVRFILTEADLTAAATDLIKLGLLDDGDIIEITDLKERITLLRGIAAIGGDKVPRTLQLLRKLADTPNRVIDIDVIYALTLSSTQYYDALLSELTDSELVLSDYDSTSSLLGVRNYLLLKLANQAFREMYAELEYWCTLSEEDPTALPAPAFLFNHIYFGQSERQISTSGLRSQFRGAAYCLNYSKFLREKLITGINFELGSGSDAARLAYDAWEIIASMRNRRQFPIVEIDAFLRLLPAFGKLHTKTRAKAESAQALAKALYQFRALILKIFTAEMQHLVFTPTVLITLPSILKRVDEYLDTADIPTMTEVNGVEAIDTEDIPDQEIAGLPRAERNYRDPLVDFNQPAVIKEVMPVLLKSHRLYRKLNPNILPLEVTPNINPGLYIITPEGNFKRTAATATEICALLDKHNEDLFAAINVQVPPSDITAQTRFTFKVINPLTKKPVDANNNGGIVFREPTKGVLSKLKESHRLTLNWINQVQLSTTTDSSYAYISPIGRVFTSTRVAGIDDHLVDIAFDVQRAARVASAVLLPVALNYTPGSPLEIVNQLFVLVHEGVVLRELTPMGFNPIFGYGSEKPIARLSHAPSVMNKCLISRNLATAINTPKLDELPQYPDLDTLLQQEAWARQNIQQHKYYQKEFPEHES